MPSRDHPRVCGEQLTVAVTVVPVEGSSPRVRGAAEVNGLRDKRVGIIPACAGSRSCRGPPRALAWDHPRVCGEQKGEPARGYHGSGSSPRVRGAARLDRQRGCRLGIIPACAGSRLKDSE